MKALLVVALGGSLGAVGRYGLALLFNQARFDLSWGTWLANILGSLIIGSLLAWDHARSIPELWRLFLMVGICGALTTFSSFAVEALLLGMKGKVGLTLVHIGMHVFGSLLAVWGAYVLVKKWIV